MHFIRRSSERGQAHHGWLESRHTFSFGSYSDSKFTGFGHLLVINEDEVQPGQGFGSHSHKDMEIVSYIIEGELEHRDSLGTGSVIRPGDIQRMSAGTGAEHSEFNPSKTQKVHFLQIWIAPAQLNLAPSYEQKTFSVDSRKNRLTAVVSHDGRSDSLRISQDAVIFSSFLEKNNVIKAEILKNRRVWIQVIKGHLEIKDVHLYAGDGFAVWNENELAIVSLEDAEFLYFDLA